LAHRIDGSTVYAKAGKPVPTLAVFVPYLTFYNPVGSLVGITYHVTDGVKLISTGEPQGNLAPDGSVSFTPSFTPVKGHSYLVTATVNDAHGNLQTRQVEIVATP
jgi:hypothetical protein